MNNSVDFVRSLNSNNLSSIITTFFDEIMVLYNLVGSRTDINICMDDNASLASFDLLMESEDDAKKVYENLNGSSFSVYSDVYNIDMILNKSSISATISKATR